MIRKSLCMFIVSCLLMVLTQPMAVAEGRVLSPTIVPTQENHAQELSAVERVETIEKKFREQRTTNGFASIGIIALIYSLVFVYINNSERGLKPAVEFLFYGAPLMYLTGYLYGEKGMTYLLNATPIEKDASELGKIEGQNEKEKKAIYILKNNVIESEKERGRYSRYDGIFLIAPKINTNIINDNLTEYIELNQINLDSDEYETKEFRNADIETKTRWLMEWEISKETEMSSRETTTNKYSVYEGWVLGMNMDTSHANIGDYIYPIKGCSIYDDTGPSAKYQNSLSTKDKCLVVDLKNEARYRFLSSFNNGLWYKVRILRKND